MPDERKVTRGQKLRFPASTYNAMIDAVKAHQSQRLREGPRGPLHSLPLAPANTILLRNTLGTLTRPFHVFKVGTPVLTPEGADGTNLLDRVAFDGEAPSADDPIAILEEPAGNGDLRRAVVSGVTCCYVNMLDAGHQWAKPVGGGETGYLESAECGGQARILHAFDDGGTPPVEGAKLCLVHLIGYRECEGGGGGVSSWKNVVRCATTTAGTLASSFENGDTVDAVALATGDRILIKNQADQTENGIYTVNASGAPTRAADDGGYDDYGAVVYVTEGLDNDDTIWANTANPNVSGTDPKWYRVWPILYATGGGAVSISSDSTWTDGGTVTVPETGLYEVSGTLMVEAPVFTAGFDTVDAKIVNNSGGATVMPTVGGASIWKLITALVGGFPATHTAAGAFSEVVSLTAGTVLKFQARRNAGGGTVWGGVTVYHSMTLKPLR